jgi:hypothetical protein
VDENFVAYEIGQKPCSCVGFMEDTEGNDFIIENEVGKRIHTV